MRDGGPKPAEFNERRKEMTKYEREHGGRTPAEDGERAAKIEAAVKAAMLEKAQDPVIRNAARQAASLKGLREELKEALDSALNLADSIRGRLEELKSENLGLAIRAGERYAEIENAQDVAERISIALRKAIEDELKGDLESYPFEEMDGWACYDDAETEGDRRYHEAKDEGRLR
jgi:hypothetical protein